MSSPTTSSSLDDQDIEKEGNRSEYEPQTGNSGTSELTLGDRISESAISDRQATENAVNFARLQQYREHFTTGLLSLIAESDFEYGFSSALDTFLQERLSENALATKEWLNSLFVQFFGDVAVATGVLRTAAHLEYDEIAPQGPTMALAALSHTDVEVRECGIRAFENWATRESLNILKKVRCPERWMQEYVTQVVNDLEQELGIDVAAGKKD